MQTKQELFLDLLGTEDTQFVIPVYQRVYSWGLQQCKGLWQDINRSGRTGNAHFIGTVLYSPDRFAKTAQHQLDVIDGQQRMTTLTIVIAALVKYLRAHGATADGLTANLDYFYGEMEKSDFDADVLWAGMKVLTVIDAELDRGDNPQLIFESLNARGVPLTTADLVRNYLLIAMDHDEQTRLYKEYWEPIEVMFGDDPGAEKLNAAIRTWLSIRFPKVRIHDKSETYSVFKTYIEDEHAGTPEELLDELRGFCFMWAENYNFHEVKEFRSMNWAKGKRRTLVPERASQGGF